MGVVRALAIETATTACSIALLDGNRREARLLAADRRHVEVLAPGIAALLEDFALRAGDLERIVVDRGPGLFTGLRVGLATAFALADATGAGLVGVTSLELLAHGAHEAGVRGRLMAVVDGRRGEVFTQRFELADEVTAESEPAVERPRDVVIAWATNGAAVTFCGDGVARYERDFAAVPNGTLHPLSVPPTLAALDLAGREPGPVAPLYLREADAVANFVTRDAR